jgi:hypothetical protein
MRRFQCSTVGLQKPVRMTSVVVSRKRTTKGSPLGSGRVAATDTGALRVVTKRGAHAPDTGRASPRPSQTLSSGPAAGEMCRTTRNPRPYSELKTKGRRPATNQRLPLASFVRSCSATWSPPACANRPLATHVQTWSYCGIARNARPPLTISPNWTEQPGCQSDACSAPHQAGRRAGVASCSHHRTRGS